MQQRKLFVPKGVSFNSDTKKGYESRATKAFVPKGTRVKLGKRASKYARRVALRKLATEAEFFIKPVSSRQRRIAELLNKAGIRTEKIIQDLKNGTALIQREGYSLDTPQGKELMRRDPFSTIYRVEEMVSEMHSLGITHGHLHVGNIAILPDRSIALIDLGRATISKVPEKASKAWTYRKYANDLKTISRDLTILFIGVSRGTITDGKRFQAAVISNILLNYPKDFRAKLDSGALMRVVEEVSEKKR